MNTKWEPADPRFTRKLVVRMDLVVVVEISFTIPLRNELLISISLKNKRWKCKTISVEP